MLLVFMLLFSIYSQGVRNDSVAQFYGGKKKLNMYFKENMKWKQGQFTVEGKVYISFIVSKNGNINQVKIIRSLCSTCDIEAIRLIKNMPNWIPAKKNGKYIQSEIILSVDFRLSNNEE